MKQTQRKLQLQKQVKIDLNRLTHNDKNNNAYFAEINLRKKLIKKKKAHNLAQKRYRNNHAEEIKIYNRKYYLAHRKLKRICEHIAKLTLNQNGSAFLVCSLCNTLIAKVGF